MNAAVQIQSPSPSAVFHIYKRDVKVQVQRHERTIWLSERVVVEQAGISGDYLRTKGKSRYKASVQSAIDREKSVLPVTGKAWRYATFDGRTYYDEQYIPQRHRDKLPTPLELLGVAQGKAVTDEEVAEAVEGKLQNALECYLSHTDLLKIKEEGADGRGFAILEAGKYLRAKAYMDMATGLLAHRGYIGLGIRTRTEFYKILTSLLQREATAGEIRGIDIKNPDALRQKLSRYMKLGNDQDARRGFIVGRKWNNLNARIARPMEVVNRETGEIEEHDVHRILMEFFYMGYRPDGKQGFNKERKTALYDKYKKAMSQQGIEAMSYRSYCRYTKDIFSTIQTASARHGSKYADTVHMPYIRAKKLEYADSLWAIDGSGTKLTYQDMSSGQLRVRTLYAFYVFDVASRKILGYHLSEKRGESWEELIRPALKMAYKTSGRTMPRELVCDNASGLSKNKDSLRLMTEKLRCIAPGNSQANMAETLIRLFIHSVADQLNFAGTFNSKHIEYKGNAEGLDKNELMTQGGAEMQMAVMVERWNKAEGTDGRSPNQIYDEDKNEDTQQMSIHTYRELFGWRSTRTLSGTRGYITLTKNKEDYCYTLPQYPACMEQISKAVGSSGKPRIEVRFDKDGAGIYTLDGRHILDCEPTKEAHKSYAEATDDTRQALQTMKKTKEDAKTEINAHNASVVETAQSILQEEEPNPEPLEYNILTIGGGNVKDVTNRQQEEEMSEEMSEAEIRRARAIERRQKAGSLDKL